MELTPVAVVRSRRDVPTDDDWDGVVSTVTLDAGRFTPEALLGLDAFSHVEVVFVFDRVDPADVQTGARHPRERTDWPRVGIFAQRGKVRPNRIGVTVCRLLGVDGLTLTVQGLDAIDGTPVLDIKPYMTEFAARGPVRQPAWSRELMAGYWTGPSAASDGAAAAVAGDVAPGEPTAPVTVRPVAAADHDRWRELFVAYGAFYETRFDDDVLDGVWAWLLDEDHPVRCLVAERGGVVVGFAHHRQQPDTFSAGPGWFLDDLFTDPAHRGTGAARALVAAVEEHARARGGGTLRWITADDNLTAQRFYDRVATRTRWVTYEVETTAP